MADEVVLVKEGKITTALNAYGEKLAQTLALSEPQKQKAFGMALKLSQDSKLQNVNQSSLIAFCFEVARHNYIRDDALYPIPYNGLVQAQAGYKSLREELERSGKYRVVDCVEVKECDSIIVNPYTSYVKLKFETDFDVRNASKVKGYYAFAVKRNERVPFMSEYWTVEQVEAHRNRYSKKNQYGEFSPAWKDSFTKMAQKTVFKQLANKLDLTPEAKSLLELDQIVFDEDGKPIYLDNPRRQTENNDANLLAIEELKEKPIEEPKPQEEKKEEEK